MSDSITPVREQETGAGNGPGSQLALAVPSPWGRTGRWAAFLILLGTLLLHWRSLVFPMLIWDDFPNIADAWPWERCVEMLWRPHNEHAMPLGRLITYPLVEFAGSASALPWVLGALGPAALLLTMGLVYLFVRRELDHPLSGLVAMGLFGLTSQYEETVFMFAAAFFFLAFTTTLLALLAAQWAVTGPLERGEPSWGRDGSKSRADPEQKTGSSTLLDHDVDTLCPTCLSWTRTLFALLLCALCCAAAPAWSAIGIVAGPLCALYLLLRWPGNGKRAWLVSFLLACIPCLGSALFLLVNLSLNAQEIMHTAHYGDKNAVESFLVGEGAIRTFTAFFDQCVLGTLGLVEAAPHRTISLILAIPVVVAGCFWYRKATFRYLLILGLAFIVTNDLLIYSSRAGWQYERIRLWSRYQLFPHFGVILFLLGGLQPWLKRWEHRHQTSTTPEGRTQLIQIVPLWAWVLLVVLLIPHVIICSTMYYDADRPQQMEQLAQIDAIDQHLREHHISRELAIQVLPPMKMAGSDDRSDNGWLLLRGSNDPHPMSVEEARNILLPLARKAKEMG